MFLLIVGIELLVEGPVIVGLPILGEHEAGGRSARPWGGAVRLRRRVAMRVGHGCNAAGTQAAVRAAIGRPVCVVGSPVDALRVPEFDVDRRRRGPCDRGGGGICGHHVHVVATGAHAQKADGPGDEPSDDFRRWPLPSFARRVGCVAQVQPRMGLRRRGRVAGTAMPRGRSSAAL